MKDKLEKLQKKMLRIIDEQLNGDLTSLCTKELGDAVDIVKDFSMIMYYMDVVEAMEESNIDEKKKYISKYAPETSITYSDSSHKRMEFMKSESTEHRAKELSEYVKMLSHEMMEMIETSSDSEKTYLKQKMNELINSL